MTTDERVDRRLTEAGERWRTAHATVAEIDIDAATRTDDAPADGAEPAHGGRDWRRWAAGAAAAVVVASVAVWVIAVRSGEPPSTGGGGQSAAATGHRPLVGTQWHFLWAVKNGKPVIATMPADLGIDGQHHLRTTGWCASPWAAVRVRGNRLDLTAWDPRKEFCHPPIKVAQADIVAEVLTGSVQWSINGTTLTLTKSGVGQLIYTALPRPTTEPTALVGFTWRLVAAHPGGALGSYREALTLEIASDGQMGYSDGCNGTSAHAQLRSGSLKISAGTSTSVACAQVRRVDKVLTGDVAWYIEQGTLTITKPGVGTLTYRRS